MSPAPKSEEIPWRPTAGLESLRRRADLLALLRRFFAEREVLEVETPLLATGTATDVHLHSLSCLLESPEGPRRLFLQTSPEFAMKRLLAAGSGPIYQISKAFRDGEVGRLHNPEFTLLEWYRPGFDHHALMDEVDALLGAVLSCPRGERLTYRAAFERHLGLDPHRATVAELASVATSQGIDLVGAAPTDRDGWLQLLMAVLIEPQFDPSRPTFIMDFPASQAALARIRPGDPPLAERFEAYVGGVELANGFHELADTVEQRKRFLVDLEQRRRAGLPAVPLDERFLAALEVGLPDCAGVALGVDRLLLLATGARDLTEVVAFPISRV
jgi:lysyl-tRNA synthetase class 2